MALPDLKPGWMVEEAYKYAKLSAIALQEGNLGLQSEVNAAFSVELLLKSLFAEPEENDFKGTLKTQFQVTRKFRHDLYAAYESIPDELKVRFRLGRHERMLKEKRRVFENKRYAYEANSEAGSFDTLLLHFAADLIPKVVDYYIECGSDDP